MTDTDTEEGELHAGIGLSTYFEMEAARLGVKGVAIPARKVHEVANWCHDPVPQEPPLGYDINALPDMRYNNGVGPEAVRIPDPAQPQMLTLTRKSIAEALAKMEPEEPEQRYRADGVPLSTSLPFPRRL